MENYFVALDERLANVGDSLVICKHLNESGYSLGEHDFTLPEGISIDVILTNADEGILVSGLLKAKVEGVCDRCLEKACFDVASEVDEYYLFEEPEEVGEDEDEADFLLVGADGTIDLAPALMSALIMDTPFVVLCDPDCKGLCPTCGTNLNEGECDCARKREEEELELNPFAVLRQLNLDDSGEQSGDNVER